VCRTTKLPTKGVAFLARGAHQPNVLQEKALSYPRAIRVRGDVTPCGRRAAGRLAWITYKVVARVAARSAWEGLMAVLQQGTDLPLAPPLTAGGAPGLFRVGACLA
jgi:hypothetical protein